MRQVPQKGTYGVSRLGKGVKAGLPCFSGQKSQCGGQRREQGKGWVAGGLGVTRQAARRPRVGSRGPKRRGKASRWYVTEVNTVGKVRGGTERVSEGQDGIAQARGGGRADLA